MSKFVMVREASGGEWGWGVDDGGGKRKPGLEMVEAVLGGLGAELTVVDRKDEWSGIGGE